MKPSFAICCNNPDCGQGLADGARQVVVAAMVEGPPAELEFRNRFLRTMRFSISKIAGVLQKARKNKGQQMNSGTAPSIFRELWPKRRASANA